MRPTLHLLAFLFVFAVHAQHPLLQYRTLVPSDGLAGSTVYSITQDDEGFVWISTSEGIQQYDGYRFRTFTKNTSGLRAHNYQCLLKVKGRIWAVTRRPNILVDIIDPSNGQVNHFETVFPDCPLAMEEVTHVASGPDQSVYLLLKTGQIWHFDGQFRRVELKDDLLRVKYIFTPTDSTVWFIGQERFCELRYQNAVKFTERYDTLESHSGDAAYALSSGFFSSLKTAPLSHVGFYFKKTGQRSQPKYEIPNGANVDLSRYFGVCADRLQRLWLYRKGAIDIVESGSGRKITELNLNQIASTTGHELTHILFPRIYFDLNNTAWLATTRGILLIKMVENQFQPFLTGQGISTRGMAALDNQRVIVSSYKGLKLINLDEPDTWEEIPTVPHTSISVLFEAPVLWIGTHENSLMRHNMANGQYRRYYFPQVTTGRKIFYGGLACYRDSHKRLWVGTERNLLWLDEKRDTLLEYAPFQSVVESSYEMMNVRQIFENDEGLWLVTNHGLFLKPASADTIESIGDFMAENIYHVYIDSDGIFWMATRGEGVLRWDRKNNDVARFTDRQGLSNNTIYAIQEDKNGRLWMSSNVGLNVLDKKSGTIQTLFTNDGLSNNEFNFTSHLQMPDGRMLFGGLDGLVAFYPEQLNISRNRDIPLVVWNLQRFRPATGQAKNLLGELSATGKIIVPPSENNVFIEFALLDLFNPAGNRYAYLLEGISPEWQYIHESYLRFNSLPPGTYKLRIQGISSDGATSSQELVVPIEVIAPLHHRVSFWLIVSILIGLLFFALERWRTWQLRRAKNLLEQQVVQRTFDIESQKVKLEKLNRTKDRIFAVLGHELRSPVLQLQDFSEKVDYLLKKGDIGRLQILADHLGETVEYIQEIVDNLLSWGKIQSGQQVSHPRNIELAEFADDILRHIAQLAVRKKVEFRCDEQHPLYLFADPNALSIVLRNLLHNAVKFTPPGGIIAFSAKKSGKKIVLEIKDNGVGMDEHTLRELQKGQPLESRDGTGGERGAGLGLSICRELVAQNGGQFDIKSKPNAGTSVTIKFPA